MKWLGAVIAVVVVALAGAATAGAITTPSGDPVPRYQEWAAESSVPIVAGIVVVGAPCPGQPDKSACVPVGSQTMYLYPAGLPAGSGMRQVFWHEAGHIFDHYAMTNYARGVFVNLARGALGHPTGDPGRCSAEKCWSGWWRTLGPNSPHEQFAEAYAFCARNAQRFPFDNFDGGYGWTPRHQRHHRRVCDLIRQAAD